jgi:hypothetical protein
MSGKKVMAGGGGKETRGVAQVSTKKSGFIQK